MAIADRSLHPAVEREVHHRLAEEADRRLALREVDELSLAGLPRSAQAGDQRAHGQHAGDRVRVGAVGHQRRPVAVAGHGDEAAGLLQRRAQGTVVALRSAVALAAELEIDEAWVHRSQLVPAESLSLHHRGAEVFGDGVAAGRQPLAEILAAFVREVEGDAELAAVALVEVGGAVPRPLARLAVRILLELRLAFGIDRKSTRLN